MLSYFLPLMIWTLSDSTDQVILSLQDSVKKVFQWFSDNQMKENVDKCHLFLIKNDEIQLKVGDFLIKNRTSEELLGVKIDNKPSFDKHVENIL